MPNSNNMKTNITSIEVKIYIKTCFKQNKCCAILFLWSYKCYSNSIILIFKFFKASHFNLTYRHTHKIQSYYNLQSSNILQ